MSQEQEAESWIPVSEEDKIAILEQLERLVASPFFHHSKRYPSFLKFVVAETLAGRADELKERTLGIEVFGREPDYDATNDLIVRVTAAEIRKRIAQYYQEPGHDAEIRVSLPSGSYIPHFTKPASGPASADWLVDRNVQQETGTYKDYALVARFTDPDTDRPVVVAAGLARGGTVAAGEFLVSPQLMHDLLSASTLPMTERTGAGSRLMRGR